MEQPQITLYGRPGCELCTTTEEIVRDLMAKNSFDLPLAVVNIEDDPALHARLLTQIPALEVAGTLLPLAVSPMQIAAHLRGGKGQGNGER